MSNQLDDNNLKNERTVAFLVCVYKKDDVRAFNEMVISINELELPPNVKVRVYLHIDGILPSEFDSTIEALSPFKVLQSKIPIGLAKGLNKLIGTLTDESYYFRMDSDDICYSDRVIKQIHFMDVNLNIDFCGGSISEFIGNKENQVNIRKYPSDRASILNKMPKGSPFAHVTVCFRAGFFEKFSFYPVDYPLNEDIALWYLSLQNGAQASNLEDILVHVRMDSAYGRRSFQKAVSELKVYKKIAHWQGRSFFYPYLRFVFRLFPVFLVEKIYNSKLRNYFLNK
jgi:hypothetical protein